MELWTSILPISARWGALGWWANISRTVPTRVLPSSATRSCVLPLAMPGIWARQKVSACVVGEAGEEVDRGAVGDGIDQNFGKFGQAGFRRGGVEGADHCLAVRG